MNGAIWKKNYTKTLKFKKSVLVIYRREKTFAELSSICRNLFLYITGGLFSKGVVNLKKVSLYIMKGVLQNTLQFQKNCPCDIWKVLVIKSNKSSTMGVRFRYLRGFIVRNIKRRWSLWEYNRQCVLCRKTVCKRAKNFG